MAVSIEKITLWRGMVENRPGALADVLEPITAAGANFDIVMGYREPGASRAVVEIYPVRGKKLTQVAEGAGLRPASIPALLVTGQNRAGLALRVAHAIAEGGINLTFVVAQVLGRKYTGVFGFETDADATRAVGLIRKSAR